ncbi:hypothetical protein GOP47_0011809 [Adiantum capillus-veneris]|uniref:LNS2/PITP domain-containing protein n=1 Tax=Adiantum capillus-veneris TaxID=13818 RepID=A0A9D4ZI59_ADICA|nr:hypothetical protein GOP47_0011809 [Adiantum capillus-veneris]
MYAFGMLGSYFSQGVYAVAGPFQGAVDIIVVRQEDGTYKSSPWYVKCGDFQGVLTRREKIVDISVNGIQADFYMLLNSKGEAYFEKEVEDAVLALPSTSSSGMDEVGKLNESGSSVSGTMKGDSQVESKPSSTEEKIADENTRWQDNADFQGPIQIAESRNQPDESSGWLSNQPVDLQAENNAGDVINDAGCSRDSSSSTETNGMDPFSARESKFKPSDIDAEVKPVVINVSGENLILAEADSIFSEQEPVEEQQFWSSDVGSGVQSSQDEGRPHPLDEVSYESASASGMDDAMLCKLNTVITEDWFGLQESPSFESGDKDTSLISDLEASDVKAMDEVVWNDYKIVTAEEERELSNALETDSILGVRIDGQSLESAAPASGSSGPSDSSVWVSDALVDDTISSAAIAVMEDSMLSQNDNEEGSADGAMSKKDVVCRVDEGPPTEVSKAAEIPTISVVPPPSRWTMWPLSLRRSRGEKAPVSDAAAKQQALLAATNIAVGSPLTEEILRKNGYYQWTQKPKLRSYVPTSAQIESLKLKDGPNKVTFTFPRVLGRTQVDANIYLWKWNTRIVISDVDGTITKSDVLGQFMPLVGRDWSQSGVTRLFSSIKENGYEVLFLSARAISQAYLTRQFLINLKQDGETLPEGPVFISPDGLIPSLYREVVRRAPHEFKISCLEGIKRLFPNDINPFYAGFGNRDTDEISYLKVGIPKGKIFIINPKGEVMVNHHVDVKSYTSIHALVDDMFPPVYSSEQEDFNSWNFWKLPLPDIGDEISSNTKSTKVKKSTSSKK